MSDELEAAEALKKQVHLLGQALGEVLKKIGVIGGHNMTGPELLCAAEDFCANTPDHPADDGDAVTVAMEVDPIADNLRKQCEALVLDREAALARLAKVREAIVKHQSKTLGEGWFDDEDFHRELMSLIDN